MQEAKMKGPKVKDARLLHIARRCKSSGCLKSGMKSRVEATDDHPLNAISTREREVPDIIEPAQPAHETSNSAPSTIVANESSTSQLQVTRYEQASASNSTINSFTALINEGGNTGSPDAISLLSSVPEPPESPESPFQYPDRRQVRQRVTSMVNIPRPEHRPGRSQRANLRSTWPASPSSRGDPPSSTTSLLTGAECEHKVDVFVKEEFTTTRTIIRPVPRSPVLRSLLSRPSSPLTRASSPNSRSRATSPSRALSPIGNMSLGSLGCCSFSDAFDMGVDELLWREANQPQMIEIQVETQTAVKREELWRGDLFNVLYRPRMEGGSMRVQANQISCEGMLDFDAEDIIL